MLPAFIYLAIDYDARGVGEKNSELVSVKLAVSCYPLMVPIRPRGVKLQLHQQQQQDVCRRVANNAAGGQVKARPAHACACI